ncbi:MAG: hypothetical protein HFG40_03705, partial [Bacilli bacterium]|nr:hypothetical protein [Bacilli bacterium]
MNGEDLANKAGLNRTNRFIFSDSYYEKMPEVPGRPTFDPIVPPKKEQDLSKEVMDVENQLLSQANYRTSDALSAVSNNSFVSSTPVQQASSLDQVLQNNYSSAAPSPSSGELDFFSHQVNTMVNDSSNDDFVSNNNDVDSIQSSINIPMQNENFFDMFTTRKKQENALDSDSLQEGQASTFEVSNEELPMEHDSYSSELDQKSEINSEFQLNGGLDSNFANSDSNIATFNGVQGNEDTLNFKSQTPVSMSDEFHSDSGEQKQDLSLGEPDKNFNNNPGMDAVDVDSSNFGNTNLGFSF